VLSREEVARLLAAVQNVKHHTALSVAYGAGLRASEVINLKLGDVDGQRMTLRVEPGKGRKDCALGGASARRRASCLKSCTSR
jgi:integrase/recombinase XerD